MMESEQRQKQAVVVLGSSCIPSNDDSKACGPQGLDVPLVVGMWA